MRVKTALESNKKAFLSSLESALVLHCPVLSMLLFLSSFEYIFCDTVSGKVALLFKGITKCLSAFLDPGQS